MLHVGDNTIFDSSLDPKSPISRIGRLTTALFLDEQRLLMADGMNAELHLVDVSTGDVTTVGRRGDGPGEFRILVGVKRTGDGFAAWDVGLARITMFTKTGDVADSWSYNRMWFNNPVAEPVALLSDGVAIFRDGGEVVDRHGRFRDEMRYVEVTVDGVAGVVAEAQDGEYWSGESGSYQRVMLGHLLLDAQIGDQIAIAQTDLGAVRIVTRDGKVAGTFPVGQGRRASAEQIEAAREEARERLRRRMERNERNPSGAVFRQLAEANLANVDEIPVNEMSPPIDDLFVDLDGRLWLRFYAMPDDEDARWQVWDPSDLSEPQLVVVVQPNTEVLDASGLRVVLHEKDALGSDRVVVAALTGEG